MISTPSSHAASLSGSYTPTQHQNVTYGPSAITKLPELVHLLLPSFPSDKNIRAIIVTGNSLATKTPVIDNVIKLLNDAGIDADVHKGIGQHAPVAGIKEAVKLVKSNVNNILISIGGGSPIDAAKAIAYFLHEEEAADSLDYIPHIAIPTTLSAAEFTSNAGFTGNEGDKIGVNSAYIVPKVVILDPELSLYTPQGLWIASGIRALDHAVETLYRKGAQLPMKNLALVAIKDLFEALPACKKDEKDLDARGRLQIAAWQSLWLNKLSGPAGLSHSLGHKLGARYSIAHGTCSCLTLPSTVTFMARELPTSSWGLTSLASALPFIPANFYPTSSAPDWTQEDSKREAAWKVGKSIEKLVKDLGVEGKKLDEYGVKEVDLRKIAGQALASLSGWEGIPQDGEEIIENQILRPLF
ncbi:Alcohol dehydrogenase, class IV [Phaffia rhodozyma]|uniref:Alcohol dehydrogenase, class IV n=1 Tax=Phaffia rhodozyma TaxID=264483 RepID=A0A0F7SMQ9_PHARH|nr:Alcohol dehydrogenase, class IV [Phaffia rhodozyma]